MATLTPEDARNNLRRWDLVHNVETPELRGTSMETRDLQDIEGLLQAHPSLDLSSVRQWVGEFASVTAMSDLIDDFDKLSARVNRQP